MHLYLYKIHVLTLGTHVETGLMLNFLITVIQTTYKCVNPVIQIDAYILKRLK